MDQEINYKLNNTKYKFATNYKYLNPSPNFEFFEPKMRLKTFESKQIKSRFTQEVLNEDPLNDSDQEEYPLDIELERLGISELELDR